MTELKWSGLPSPLPRDPPDLGIESGFPVLEADALPSEPPRKSKVSSILVSRSITKVDEIMTSLPRHRGLATGHVDRGGAGLGLKEAPP